jgi:pimeloyl-ACP methyl ester carboxylesterase
MVFDYRGYGRSEGRPNEEGTYGDTQAAYEWLRGRGFKPENIIAFGESLGGAIACELALREGLGGLILLSTFTSILDVGVEFYPWLPVRWLNTLKYNTLEKLRRIKVPVLIMHSPGDGLIGIGHAQKNFAAANEPKLFWETAGDHNYMLPSDHDLCAAGVEKFLKTLEPQGQIIPAAT